MIHFSFEVECLRQQKFVFGELPLIAENPTVCDDIEMAGCPAVCSIDFWGSRGTWKTACPPIRFQISVPSVFEIPNFYFLQEKVNFYDLKIGKSGFRAKKWSKLGEILSVLDEKNTIKTAMTRGIDWTPLFGAENE